MLELLDSGYFYIVYRLMVDLLYLQYRPSLLIKSEVIISELCTAGLVIELHFDWG